MRGEKDVKGDSGRDGMWKGTAARSNAAMYDVL